MAEMLYLGIDYGGNGVKMGLVDEMGVLRAKTSRPTADLLEKQACDEFAAAISAFVHAEGLQPAGLCGVGMAIPGVALPGIYSTPNVAADWPQVLKSLVRELSQDGIAVVNDANAAALGELWAGAGAGAESALLATLGSGLGSGVVVDGRVVVGAHGAAGELGHVTYERGGRLCSCGRHGCAERYASARGLVLSFREAESRDGIDRSTFGDFAPGSETDALAVANAMRAGDERGRYAFAVFADALAFALAQVACAVDPQVILLGGGLTAAADLYLEDVRAAFATYSFPACASTEIRLAELLADAGVVGAARFAMR